MRVSPRADKVSRRMARVKALVVPARVKRKKKILLVTEREKAREKAKLHPAPLRRRQLRKFQRNPRTRLPPKPRT